MMVRRAWTVALLAFVVLGSAAPAAAEGLFDLFAGAAFTQKSDVKLSIDDLSTSGKTDFKDSFSVGARVGYWWSFFGLNLDVLYYRPELDPDSFSLDGITVKTDLDVVAVGLNAMLRGQFLKDADTPAGRLQPYIFGGPTAFVTKVDFDVSGESGSDTGVTANVGFTAGGGLTFLLARNIGLFAEYRFTYNRPDVDISDVKVKAHLDTHHVLGGVTFRF
jgi:opacity protein-like surface antigen